MIITLFGAELQPPHPATVKTRMIPRILPMLKGGEEIQIISLYFQDVHPSIRGERLPGPLDYYILGLPPT